MTVDALLPTPLEQAQLSRLRRAKVGAGGLLLAAAVAYLLTFLGEDAGWVGFARAAAEAAMVGGLADWFAVTALFRRPLGLPIPHTALVPTRKDALGDSLAEFVGTHFLAPEVLRERLAATEVSARAGRWLAEPAHAARVGREVATLATSGLAVMRDDTVRDLLTGALQRRLASVHVGPSVARLLEGVLSERTHLVLVDLVVQQSHSWLRRNRDEVLARIESRAPGWAPTAVNKRVSHAVYTRLVDLAAEVVADPEHELRRTVDHMLEQLVVDLRTNPARQRQADELVRRLVTSPSLRDSAGDAVSAGRRLVADLLDDEAGELRRRVDEALVGLGLKLQEDLLLRTKVDGWVEAAVVHVATRYRDELTTVITETIRRWDGPTAARRIELAVGRDLQFIRVNGTVVGALAGVAIHAVALLL